MTQGTPQSKHIFIIAGEVSGDLHAAALVRALKELDPSLCVTAIGGKQLQATADCFLFDLASQGVSGFVEPLKKMPQWLRLLKQIGQYMDDKQPCAVIAVDYYGFNRQVLGLAEKRQIPCYYYVTPQVWATRRYRAKKLARLTRKMYVIYPFEPAFHKNYGGNAVFLGNPLLDNMPAPRPYDPHTDNPTQKAWKLGLLPGSRWGEISRLAPIFYQTFKKVLQKYPHTQAYMFLLPDRDEKEVAALLGETPHPNFRFVKDKEHQMRSQMDFLLACSGTATLENALLGIPMLVAYQLPWITFCIARLIIKVRYISLVNLLADKPLVKEFIQTHASPAALAALTEDFFAHPERLSAQHQELLTLRAGLGEPGVAKRAAADILQDIATL